MNGNCASVWGVRFHHSRNTVVGARKKFGGPGVVMVPLFASSLLLESTHCLFAVSRGLAMKWCLVNELPPQNL